MGLFFYSLSIMPSKERKEEYCEKLRALFTKYNKILVVGADNVGSSHMQSIRQSIRGKGVLLMGKNTMVRRVIRTEFEQFAPLLPSLEGNVGLLFSDSDLSNSETPSYPTKSVHQQRLEQLLHVVLPSQLVILVLNQPKLLSYKLLTLLQELTKVKL